MSTAAPSLTAPSLTAALDGLADLLAYPREDHAAVAAASRAAVAGASADAAALLDPLVSHLATADIAACEESYIRVFELNPVCALEVGWQLYGEQYARGVFMVKMRELTREVGVDPGTELPDHLPNSLRVLGRLDDAKATKLATSFMRPAVNKMREALADREGDPYRGVLDAIALLLDLRFGAEVRDE